jgi:hypothetical protein
MEWKIEDMKYILKYVNITSNLHNIENDGIIELCKFSKRRPSLMVLVGLKKREPNWPLTAKGNLSKVLIFPSIISRTKM